MRYPPPPTKFGAMPAQPKQQAAPRRGPAPPPTRYGSSVTQASSGRGMASIPLSNPGLSSSQVAQPCFDWLKSLFSKKPNNSNTGYQEISDSGIPLTSRGSVDTVTTRERIKDPIIDEDCVAKQAYRLDATGTYFFGVITGCTIVYVRGSTHGSAAHFSHQTCREDLRALLVGNFDRVDDGITHVKVFFSAEGDQEDHASLTEGQRNFRGNIRKIAPRANYMFHVYTGRKTIITLDGGGGYVSPPSGAGITVAN